jgi:DNA invertase Pin-like site-specific DNA recombinase
MARRRLRNGNPQLAIAYLRVSTPDQRIDQQRDAIERWAAASGVTIAAWCSDVGVSGAAAVDERPALIEALSSLRLRGAGLLVAAKRDRLARDVSAAATIERLSAEAGARVVTSDGLDSSDTPEGQLVRTLIDAMSQYERALIRARTKAAMAAKRKRGEVVGQPQLGLRALGGRLVEDRAEQQALDRMRRLQAAGASHAAIAKTLQVEGYKPRGKRWHTTTVTRALAKTP